MQRNNYTGFRRNFFSTTGIRFRQ